MPLGLFHHMAALPLHSTLGEGGSNSGDSQRRKSRARKGQLAEAREVT